MFVRSAAEAPERKRSGLISRVPLQQGDLPGVGLAATWGDVVSGASQRPQDHEAEQVYVMLKGWGRMLVGDEEREVGRGDLAYIPSRAAHDIENESGEPLVYVSVAAPAVDVLAAYDASELKPEESGEEEA